jgi:hypothetical protein
MGILPSKARPTWAGVLVRQPVGDVLVPWRDAIDLRVVWLDGRWVRIDFNLRDEERARALRRRALRNLWRAGEAVTWRKPVIGPAWLEPIAMLIPAGCCVTLGVMALTFAIGRMTTLNEAIRAEGVSPTLGALMWGAVVLLAIAGVGAFGFVWFGVKFWQREARSLTVKGESLTLVRRDRTIVVHASEVATVERNAAGASMRTTAGESVSLDQVCPAAYEPWLRSLPLAKGLRPVPSVWMPWVVVACGLSLTGVHRLIEGSGLSSGTETASRSIAILAVTFGFAAMLVWLRRHELSNAH